jgi:hypothetical protein
MFRTAVVASAFVAVAACARSAAPPSRPFAAAPSASAFVSASPSASSSAASVVPVEPPPAIASASSAAPPAPTAPVPPSAPLPVPAGAYEGTIADVCGPTDVPETELAFACTRAGCGRSRGARFRLILGRGSVGGLSSTIESGESCASADDSHCVDVVSGAIQWAGEGRGHFRIVVKGGRVYAGYFVVRDVPRKNLCG